MNNKIITTFILLIIVISATLLFVSFNQSDKDTNQNNYPSDDEISENDISDQVDEFFLSEDDEVDIGDMV